MRPIRLNVPGVVYHVIPRFIEERWFLAGDAERERYLALLGRSLEASDWRCLAYALMSSHVHLELVAGTQPMEELLRPMHSPFATYVNKRNERIGNVFIRGPRDIAVHGKEAAVLAYIHNNPVRARVVNRASDSHWTSHRAYLGLMHAPKWLHVAEGLQRLGLTTPAELDAFVNRTPGESGAPPPMVPRIANRRGGVTIATPSPDAYPIVARPYAHIRPAPRTIVVAVAELSGVAADILCSHQRSQTIVAARALVVHCARTLGLTYSEIAAALGISREGARKLASHALSTRGERQRDLVCERLRMETRLNPDLLFKFGHR